MNRGRFVRHGCRMRWRIALRSLRFASDFSPLAMSLCASIADSVPPDALPLAPPVSVPLWLFEAPEPRGYTRPWKPGAAAAMAADRAAARAAAGINQASWPDQAIGDASQLEQQRGAPNELRVPMTGFPPLPDGVCLINTDGSVPGMWYCDYAVWRRNRQCPSRHPLTRPTYTRHSQTEPTTSCCHSVATLQGRPFRSSWRSLCDLGELWPRRPMQQRLPMRWHLRRSGRSSSPSAYFRRRARLTSRHSGVPHSSPTNRHRSSPLHQSDKATHARQRWRSTCRPYLGSSGRDLIR